MAEPAWTSQPVTSPPKAYVTGPQGSLLPVYSTPPPNTVLVPPLQGTGITYVTCDHGEHAEWLLVVARSNPSPQVKAPIMTMSARSVAY
jgi:hypothetical protein